MDELDIIDEIRKLPLYRERVCECNERVRTYVLKIYSVCPKCGSKVKQRAMGGIGTEIHDVIDTVLEWAGTDSDLDALLKRHEEIHNDKE